MDDGKQVINYINDFIKTSGSDSVYVYTHGKCLGFAKMLSSKFFGSVIFVPGANHFVCKIGCKIYDITGNVTRKYMNHKLVSLEVLTAKQLIGYDSSL